MKQFQKFVIIFLAILLQIQHIIPSVQTTGTGDQGAILNPDYQPPQGTDGNGNGNACPSGQHCCQDGDGNATQLPIPPFTIQILDKNNTPINTQTAATGTLLNIPTSFTSATAILTVHIFSPSNTIPGTTPNYPTTDNNYLIMYTMKSASGSNVWMQYDLIPSASVPCGINIPAIASSTTTAGLPTTSISFFPGAAQYSDPQKLTIFNGTSPFTQQFLFTYDSSSYDITPISGVANSEISQSYHISSNTISSSSNEKFLDTNTINLSIMLDGSNNLFNFKKGGAIPFTASDLTTGIILNIILYPSGNSNYRAVAVLRTQDGSKYRKLYAIESSLAGSLQPIGSTPTQIIITNNNNQQTFTRTFFNPNATNAVGSNSVIPFNFAAPISLRFYIRT